MTINGSTSDGYHTFDELYHHRTMLFASLVTVFRQRAWKSRKHADGTMFDDYFIVGLTTDAGEATYHCHDKYWAHDCWRLI